MIQKCILTFCLVNLISAPVFGLDVSVGDPAFKKCIEQHLDKNKWQAIEQVTSLKCHKKGVKSIQGIEQFTHLETLSLFNNKVKSIDSDLPKSLKSLNLARNRIANVELEGFPVLNKLYVFDNKISVLKLKNMPKLSLLKANKNGMKELTYKDLPSLEKIYIFNNELEFVDIYKLPAMRYMDTRQNPMSDELYEEMDKYQGAAILHDGNADDW